VQANREQLEILIDLLVDAVVRDLLADELAGGSDRDCDAPPGARLAPVPYSVAED
jgi:hypothetical protein